MFVLILKVILKNKIMKFVTRDVNKKTDNFKFQSQFEILQIKDWTNT